MPLSLSSSARLRRPALIAILLIPMLLLTGAEREKEKDRDNKPQAGAARPPAAIEDGVAVFFSPDGGCEFAIVEQIRHARKSIDMQAYSFTNTEIASALAAAQDRGVKVRAIFDKDATGDHYSGATYCVHHDIACYTDGEHSIAHNKLMILDGNVVITGSFNFTKQAERSNAENLLILTGKRRLTAAYQRNFEEHLGHSKVYTKDEAEKDQQEREAKNEAKNKDKDDRGKKER